MLYYSLKAGDSRQDYATASTAYYFFKNLFFSTEYEQINHQKEANCHQCGQCYAQLQLHAQVPLSKGSTVLADHITVTR